MLNPALFFLHTVIIFAFLLIAIRIGKGALIALLSMGTVLANLFVTKQITFFSLTITPTDVFIVLAVLSLNLIQEFYGKKSAKNASLISLFIMIFFAVMSFIHLNYAPSSHDQMQIHFAKILELTPRIVLSSIAVFFFVQRVDIALFALLKKLFREKFFPVRTFLSLLFSQALDTILFSYLALYGVVHSLFDIMMMSFSVKVLLILLLSPMTLLCKRFYREEKYAL